MGKGDTEEKITYEKEEKPRPFCCGIKGKHEEKTNEDDEKSKIIWQKTGLLKPSKSQGLYGNRQR